MYLVCRIIGLSDCRTNGLSDYWAVRLSGCRIIGLTPHPTCTKSDTDKLVNGIPAIMITGFPTAMQ